VLRVLRVLRVPKVHKVSMPVQQEPKVFKEGKVLKVFRVQQV
jgi:hypothetical protein